MSARREKRLRALERRVEALETIAASPMLYLTQGEHKEGCTMDAVWSKVAADAYPEKRVSLLDRIKNMFAGGNENETVHRNQAH